MPKFLSPVNPRFPTLALNMPWKFLAPTSFPLDILRCRITGETESFNGSISLVIEGFCSRLKRGIGIVAAKPDNLKTAIPVKQLYLLWVMKLNPNIP